jgi:hypothetical protein
MKLANMPDSKSGSWGFDSPRGYPCGQYRARTYIGEVLLASLSSGVSGCP